MLTVASCTARMPPHISTVLRYQSGKLPLVHASLKLPRLNGPEGLREAMSAGTPGRSEATAIHANGTAQTSAAALAAIRPRLRPLALIMSPALDQPKRSHGERQQRRDADYRRGRGQPGVGVLCRLLVDVIEQKIGRVGRTALGHRHDVVDLGQRVEQRDRHDKAKGRAEERKNDAA